MWSANPEDISAFEPHKQRSMVYTPERRTLRERLKKLGTLLGGDWQTTDDAPSLSNGRRVQEMWLYTMHVSNDHGRLGAPMVHLNSPFAWDTLAFHDHMTRFVRVDQAGYTWGLLIHAKASADRANLEVLLQQKKLQPLIDPLDAHCSLDTEAPLARGDTPLGNRFGKGFCLWWRRDLTECTDQVIKGNLDELKPLCDALGWTPDRDLAGLAEKAKTAALNQPSVIFQAGDSVRIRKGLLTGRRGRVETIRADGRVLVSLGPASMDFHAEDLFREG